MFTVHDSIESGNGSSGWDCEEYGPFATEAEAESFARRLASEGYVASDDEHRLVQVFFDRCNYGGEPRHCLWHWCSSRDDENTRHTLGPSESEKQSLLIREETAADE